MYYVEKRQVILVVLVLSLHPPNSQEAPRCPDEVPEGNVCRWKNVAQGKSAEQSSKYGQSVPGLAVDGSRLQTGTVCAMTLNVQSETFAEWRVDLAQQLAVKLIVIYYHTYYTVSFNGFQLYVSNTTNRLDGIACYKDDGVGPYPPAIFRQNCSVTGQYVIVYNDVKHPAFNSPILLLCEVEVYVCEDGAYGTYCDTCGRCVGTSCDTYTGDCPRGCSPGWQGSKCDTECDIGFYGDRCGSQCQHCVDKQCHHINGSCTSGCVSGWQGDMCTKACDIGFHGERCESHCPNCVENQCNHINGSCENGCMSGWQGDMCNEVPADTSTNTIGMIVGVVVGALLVVIVVSWVIFILIRRNMNTTDSAGTSSDMPCLEYEIPQMSFPDTEPQSRNVAIATQDAQTFPDDVQLSRLAQLIGRDYKFIGRELGLSQVDLEHLDEEYKSIKERIFQMFLQWKRKKGSEATTQRLINALNAIKDDVDPEAFSLLGGGTTDANHT